MTTTAKPSADRSRAIRLAVAACRLAVSLGACKHVRAPIMADEPCPDDYRQRHPIAVQEADRSIVVFVGQRPRRHDRRRSAPTSWRMAQTWLREGTGIITVDVPVGTPNARAATETLREIQAMFAAAGVPPRGVSVRQYTPQDPRHLAAIRINYPKISATAGPCGLWPEDLGPSYKNKSYLGKQALLQFRLRHSAQPRRDGRRTRPTSCSRAPETPAYTMRRNAALEQVSQGRRRPRPTIPMPTRPRSAIQANDQLRAPERGQQQSERTRRRPTNTSRRAPRVSVQAFCETVETAAAVQSAGEDRRLGKAHLKIQMGGMAAAIEAYRIGADAERHHPGDREPQRHPARPRPARNGLRRRHARRRHRPDQRRLAVPRAGAPRRQRLRDRAGRPRSTSCARSATCSPRPRPSRSAASSRSSAPRAASAPRPSRTTSPGRSPAIWRWIRSSPTSTSPSAPPASTTTRTRRRASPTRCSRPTASIPPSSTACCRNAPII